MKTKCRYYYEELERKSRYGDGCCYGMKNAPRVSCKGDETKCEMCKRSDEKSMMRTDDYMYLRKETVYKVQCTCEKKVEKVYCKTIQDAVECVNLYLRNRNLDKCTSVTVTPIQNLYYSKE